MEDPLFSRLQKSHNEDRTKKPAPQQPQITEAELHQIRAYFASLIERNSTRPANISSISVLGGSHTNSSFLEAQLHPLLSGRSRSLIHTLKSIDQVQTNLQSLGIFDNVYLTLDDVPDSPQHGHRRGGALGYPLYPFQPAQPPPQHGGSSPLNLQATLHVQESKRFVAKTGTDLGNGEGSGYVKFTWKNVFGNAEIMSLDASVGTRTRNNYLATFTKPVRILLPQDGQFWLNSETLAFITSRNIDWASQEQNIKGLSTKLRSKNSEFGLEHVWRSVYAKDNSSESIRRHSGNSIKSSLTHSWIPWDTRDNAFLPTRGIYTKLLHELGLTTSTGIFYKSSLESCAAATIFNGRLTTSATFRAGALVAADKSHIMDRFYLGGPNDVRGFYLNSMGPRDLGDSLGGNLFYAFGLSVFSAPLPKVPASTPLRLHGFVNGGHLSSSSSLKSLDRPSITSGVGLVFTHPMARFELNCVMPIVTRNNESFRQGFQFGIGLSFM